MNRNEAAVAIREIDRMIAEMRRAQAVTQDVFLLIRIGVQLDNLRQEQRWLIGYVMRGT